MRKFIILLVHATLLATNAYYILPMFEAPKKGETTEGAEEVFAGLTSEDLWRIVRQFLFLTNISHFIVTAFYLVTVLQDVRFLKYPDSCIVAQRYGKKTQTLFLVALSLSFLVSVLYWVMFTINPKLLFGDRDWTKFDQFFLKYIHGYNHAFLYLEFLLYTQKNHVKLWDLVKIDVFLFVVYNGLKALVFQVRQQHVYGFEAKLEWSQLIDIYVGGLIFTILYQWLSLFIARKLDYKVIKSE